MTPERVIREVKGAGVTLELSPTGTIKAVGDPAAVRRWAPALQAQKSGIVHCLEDERILRWLNAVDETGDWTDPIAVEELMVRARTEPQVRAYYLRRAADLSTRGLEVSGRHPGT
jgi:hypothetical protein